MCQQFDTAIVYEGFNLNDLHLCQEVNVSSTFNNLLKNIFQFEPINIF